MNVHGDFPSRAAAAGEVEGYVRAPPGEIVTGLRRGDVLLIRTPSLLGWAIRLFARIRFGRDDRRYCFWSHTAMVISDFDHVIHVDSYGAVICHIEEYRRTDFCCVRLRLSLAARDDMSDYARRCAGQPYDLAGFFRLALSVLLGDRLRVPDSGRPGCTSLIVHALERAGLTFERRASELMPADLAKRFGVLP
jgi:hypothetical protein